MKTIEQFREKKDALVAEYNAMPTLSLDVNREHVPLHLDDKAFLEWLVNVGVAVYNTVDSESKVVCRPFKNRSMPDLYKLHNAYKPIELEQLILNLLSLTRDTRIQTYYCGQILRRVWFSVHYGHGYKDDLRNVPQHLARLTDKGIINCFHIKDLLEYEQLIKNPKKTTKRRPSEEDILPTGIDNNVTFNTGTGEFRWTVPEGMRTVTLDLDGLPQHPIGNEERPAMPMGERLVGDTPSIRITRMEGEANEEFAERLRYITGRIVEIHDGINSYIDGEVTAETIGRYNEIRDRRLTGVIMARVEGENHLEFIRRVNYVAGRQVTQTNMPNVVRLQYCAPDVITRHAQDLNYQWNEIEPSFLRIVRQQNESADIFVSRLNYIAGINAYAAANIASAIVMPRTTMRTIRYNQVKQIIDELRAEHGGGHNRFELFTPEYVLRFNNPFSQE